MLIRNYQGKLVHFNIDKYSNEKDMYIDLWKIIYNIVLPYSEMNTNRKIISHINILNGKN
jgi:hypothetical protein